MLQERKQSHIFRRKVKQRHFPEKLREFITLSGPRLSKCLKDAFQEVRKCFSGKGFEMKEEKTDWEIKEYPSLAGRCLNNDTSDTNTFG